MIFTPIAGRVKPGAPLHLNLHPCSDYDQVPRRSCLSFSSAPRLFFLSSFLILFFLSLISLLFLFQWQQDIVFQIDKMIRNDFEESEGRYNPKLKKEKDKECRVTMKEKQHRTIHNRATIHDVQWRENPKFLGFCMPAKKKAPEVKVLFSCYKN